MRQLLLLLTCAAAGLYGQDFTGTWEARVNGTVVCTFKFEGAPLKGTDLGCYIAVNGQGELLVPGSREPYPAKSLTNVQVDGKTLTFQIDPADEDDPVIRVEMQQTGDEQAELRFLNFPVPVKPIRFVKRP